MTKKPPVPTRASTQREHVWTRKGEKVDPVPLCMFRDHRRFRCTGPLGHDGDHRTENGTWLSDGEPIH